MSKYKAAFEKHFGDITQAQFVAQPPQDREEDDVCGKFKIVKRSTSSFIEDMLAMWAEEYCRAKLGFLGSFFDVSCCAIGAVHWSMFLVPSEWCDQHTSNATSMPRWCLSSDRAVWIKSTGFETFPYIQNPFYLLDLPGIKKNGGILASTGSYAKAFYDPPSGFPKSQAEKLFPVMNQLLFAEDMSVLTVYRWSTDWADYFNPGNDWWGSYLWTVFSA
jgi:hypothetical protein